MRAIVFTLVGALTPAFLFGQLPDTHCAYSRILRVINYSFAGGFSIFFMEGLIRNENKLIGPFPLSPLY
jgi:hypothetical protein